MKLILFGVFLAAAAISASPAPKINSFTEATTTVSTLPTEFTTASTTTTSAAPSTSASTLPTESTMTQSTTTAPSTTTTTLPTTTGQTTTTAATTLPTETTVTQTTSTSTAPTTTTTTQSTTTGQTSSTAATTLPTESTVTQTTSTSTAPSTTTTTQSTTTGQTSSTAATTLPTESTVTQTTSTSTAPTTTTTTQSTTTGQTTSSATTTLPTESSTTSSTMTTTVVTTTTTLPPTEGPTTTLPPTEGSSTTVTTTTTTQTTTTPFVPECNENTPGSFPHPTECNLYYTCSNGNLFIQTCPPGLVFNPNGNICDWPANVDCGNAAVLEMPSDQPTECPAVDVAGELVRIPHETNCNFYYLCNNGSRVLYRCADEMHLNPMTRVCSPSNEAGCNVCPVVDPPSHTVRIPHETNCNFYYLCNSGNGTLYMCANEFHLSPILRICLAPNEAGCQ